MKTFSLSLKKTVLPLFCVSLLIYIIGIFQGFYTGFITYIGYWTTAHPSITLYFQPIYVFEIYPKFVLMFSPVRQLLFYDRFSIISVVFLVSAISAILFVYFNKISAALFFSVLGSLFATMHYILLGHLI